MQSRKARRAAALQKPGGRIGSTSITNIRNGKDPGELNNLCGKPGYAALTQQLLERITELRKETGDSFVAE